MGEGGRYFEPLLLLGCRASLSFFPLPLLYFILCVFVFLLLFSGNDLSSFPFILSLSVRVSLSANYRLRSFELSISLFLTPCLSLYFPPPFLSLSFLSLALCSVSYNSIRFTLESLCHTTEPELLQQIPLHLTASDCFGDKVRD